MTQSLNALFSPETSPHTTDLQAFRFLTDSLFFYALPERSAPLSDNKTGEDELWTGYTPVRLSEDEQARFIALTHELRGHEGEFHAGLLASLSAGNNDREEASAGSLASSLRSGAKAAPPQKSDDEERLWQAMLILKLAEMYREKEREITKEFMAVSDKEAELFAAVRGEENPEEEETDEKDEETLRLLAAAKTLRSPSINLPRLAKAWGHLYLRDTKAAAIPLLATTHEDLQGLLAEAYGALSGRLPRQLARLVLPSQTHSPEAENLVKKFRDETGSFREHFNGVLVEIAASGSISTRQLEELQRTANGLNLAALPYLKKSPADKGLTFFAFEGTSLKDIFAWLCDAPSAEPRQSSAGSTGLLAVLS